MLARHSCIATAPGTSHSESKVELSKMREIDSIPNNPEERLSRALRSLAKATDDVPPAHVGETLARAFYRRHARRRAARRAAVIAAVLAVLTPVLLMVRKTSVQKPANAPTQPVASTQL